MQCMYMLDNTHIIDTHVPKYSTSNSAFFTELKLAKFTMYLSLRGLVRYTECCLLLWRLTSGSPAYKTEAKKVYLESKLLQLEFQCCHLYNLHVLLSLLKRLWKNWRNWQRSIQSLSHAVLTWRPTWTTCKVAREQLVSVSILQCVLQTQLVWSTRPRGLQRAGKYGLEIHLLPQCKHLKMYTFIFSVEHCSCILHSWL